VDRAEFAAMIQKKLLTKTKVQVRLQMFLLITGRLLQLRKPTKPDLWRLSWYFVSPDQEIPKVQAIVALANGLNLTASGSASDTVPTTQMPECSQPTPLMM